MKEQIVLLRQYLTGRCLPFEDNIGEQSINLIIDHAYGETFCMFHYDITEITHWSILSLRIPPRRITDVCIYLKKINRELKAGRFYLDEQTGCVVFTLSYCLQQAPHPVRQKSFRLFCERTMDTVPYYLEAIRNIAFERIDMHVRHAVH